MGAGRAMRMAVVAPCVAACALSSYDVFGVAEGRPDAGSAPSHCADDLPNYDESDTDCGGSCSPCANGRACVADRDCAGTRCEGAQCTPPPSCTSEGCGDRCGAPVDRCGEPLSCAGCSSPPNASCDGNTAVAWTAQGICDASSRCVYAPTRTPCPGACSAGRCGGCPAGSRECSGTCAACPADAGVASTKCEGTRCVAASCAAGYETCAEGCCRWGIEIVDDATDRADVALDSQGRPHVAYVKTYGGVPFAFHAQRRADGTWTQDRLAQHGGGFLSMLVPQGEPVVAFDEPTQPIIVMRRSGAQWTPQTVDGMDSVDHAVADPDGTIYVSGLSQPERSRSWYLSVGWFDATQGSVSFVEYVEPALAQVSLAMSGYLVAMAYVQRADPYNQWVNGGLKVASGVGKSLGGGSMIYTDSSAGSMIGDELGATGVAFDGSGRWRVAFVHSNKLKLAAEGRSQSAFSTVLTRSGIGALKLRVAADGTNHVVYASGGALRHVHGATTFTDEALAGATGARGPFGLALDGGGRVVTAWVDSASGKAKILRFGP